MKVRIRSRPNPKDMIWYIEYKHWYWPFWCLHDIFICDEITALRIATNLLNPTIVELN